MEFAKFRTNSWISLITYVMLKLSALCPKGDRENAIMSNKAQLTDLPFRQKCQITKKNFCTDRNSLTAITKYTFHFCTKNYNAWY